MFGNSQIVLDIFEGGISISKKIKANNKRKKPVIHNEKQALGYMLF